GNGIAADLTVSPGAAGEVMAVIALQGLDGAVIEPIEIGLAFANPDLGVEPFEIVAGRSADGAWATPSFTLPLPGTWTVEVTVLVSDFDRRIISGAIAIPDAATAAAAGAATVGAGPV